MTRMRRKRGDYIYEGVIAAFLPSPVPVRVEASQDPAGIEHREAMLEMQRGELSLTARSRSFQGWRPNLVCSGPKTRACSCARLRCGESYQVTVGKRSKRIWRLGGQPFRIVGNG